MYNLLILNNGIHFSNFIKSFSATYPRQQAQQQAKQGSPDISLPSNLFHLGPQSVPKPDKIYNPSRLFLVYPGGLLPFGRVPKTSKEKCPGDILIKYSKHLNLLPLMRGSSNCTLSSFLMSELLTLSLRVSLTALRRKLISAAYIRYLILSLVTIGGGLEHRSTGRSQALSSG